MPDLLVVEVAPVRVHAGREDHSGVLRCCDPQVHSLDERRGAVIERGIGHLHAGQQRHLALELEQHLQRALAHLRLVRRVGGQELAAHQQLIDAGRDVVAIGAGAEEARHRVRRVREADARDDAVQALRANEHVDRLVQVVVENAQVVDLEHLKKFDMRNSHKFVVD